MPTIRLDTSKPPACPRCGQPCFRAGHCVEFMVQLQREPEGGTFVVCMHCSAIWHLTGTLEAMTFKPASEKYLKLLPQLTQAARQFRRNRLDAARVGLSLDEFVALVDVVRENKLRGAMGPKETMQ